MRNEKKRKLEEDRRLEIEKANTHLVDRMVSIAQSSGTVDTRSDRNSSRLQEGFNEADRARRKKEKERLTFENERFGRRLNNVKGSYSDVFPEGAKKSQKVLRSDIFGGRHGAGAPTPSKPSGPTGAKSPRLVRTGPGVAKPQFVNLWTVGARLGKLHVKLSMSMPVKQGKSTGENVRVVLYEPLSCATYPTDLTRTVLANVVGEHRSKLMHLKTDDAKKMWKGFASCLSLVQNDDKPNSYKLIVQSCMDDVGGDDNNGMGFGSLSLGDEGEGGGGKFEIVETNFEFADPLVVHDPERIDAAVRIQSQFRKVSSTKAVGSKRSELALVLQIASPKKKKLKYYSTKRGKKSPEKSVDKSAVEMIETYNAQAVIAKHVKGLSPSSKPLKPSEAEKEEAEKAEKIRLDEGATVISSLFRKKQASVVVQKKKDQKKKEEGSTKIAGLFRQRKATQVVQEKKLEQKQKDEGATRIGGLFRKRKAVKVVQERKEVVKEQVLKQES